MDFTFTQEQEMFRQSVRKFVDNEIKPLAKQIDEEEEVPWDLLEKMAQLGFMGVIFPEEYDGGGGSMVDYCILMEELARGCSSTALVVGVHQSVAAMAIYLGGTEEQRREILPPLARGERIAAFALTEPNFGSDAASIETTAQAQGDGYVINGQKMFITNGDIAEVFVVFAVTDKGKGARGITAFVVEKDTPGFQVGRKEKKMGLRGSSTTELIFEDMWVPRESVLGEVGEGFITAMRTLDVSRISIAAECVGTAKELLALSTEYARQRIQFGRPIAEHQAIQWMLAEMATDILAMEGVTYRAAWMRDQGMGVTREASMAKLFCSEALDRVVDKAVQIHGGMGYVAELPIERFYRDCRAYRIVEGTSEVQKIVISREVIKRGGY